MYCTRKVTEDLIYVGASDRRLAMFEGVYSVPKGVSYNSYLLKDYKTVLFDTVDKAVSKVFLENVCHELGERKLDYLVVHHMEPDHSATLTDILNKYPDTIIVCNEKIKGMIYQFFNKEYKYLLVKENDTLCTGNHTLTFIMAPMVHWPEVMMTYDSKDKILFTADAFGTFGALNGALFSDEVDFFKDYIDEARRYYTNIVGKYGQQVQSVLNKAKSLDIEYICPLHGFVWRNNINDYMDKYMKWSSYTEEEKGVLIVYASVYGNTENVCDIVSTKLRESGVKTVMYDVSVTPKSELIAEAFKYSHILIASTTYNAHIFVEMEAFLTDLVNHNIENKTIAIIENGSWAPMSGTLIKEMFKNSRNINILDNMFTIKSSINESRMDELNTFINDIISSIIVRVDAKEDIVLDNTTLFNLSYGLFVLTTKDEIDNGCIINTVMQVASSPNTIAISVNKNNLSHDTILKTNKFNVSILTEETPFKLFEHFGFKSGRDTNKFDSFKHISRSNNGLLYLNKYSNSYLSLTVIKTIDLGSHTLFIASLDEARKINDNKSVTYSYYFEHIKPKPQQVKSKGKVYICTICGYIYDEEVEGVAFESLPDDWVCPLCKHPKSDFILQE